MRRLSKCQFDGGSDHCRLDPKKGVAARARRIRKNHWGRPVKTTSLKHAALNSGARRRGGSSRLKAKSPGEWIVETLDEECQDDRSASGVAKPRRLTEEGPKGPNRDDQGGQESHFRRGELPERRGTSQRFH